MFEIKKKTVMNYESCYFTEFRFQTHKIYTYVIYISNESEFHVEFSDNKISGIRPRIFKT